MRGRAAVRRRPGPARRPSWRTRRSPRRVAMVGGIITELPPLGLTEGVGGPDPHAVHRLGVVVRALLVGRGDGEEEPGVEPARASPRPASPSGRRSAARRGRAPSRRDGTARPSTARRRGRLDGRRRSGRPDAPSRRRASRRPASSKHSRTAATQYASPPRSTPRAADADAVVEPVAPALDVGGRRRPRRPGRPGTRTSRRRTTACVVRRSTNTSSPTSSRRRRTTDATGGRRDGLGRSSAEGAIHAARRRYRRARWSSLAVATSST